MAWHLIKMDSANCMEFLIDSEDDINNPPADINYAASSIAHTPGYTHMYEADASGNWVEIASSGSSGGGGSSSDGNVEIIEINQIEGGMALNKTASEINQIIDSGKLVVAATRINGAYTCLYLCASYSLSGSNFMFSFLTGRPGGSSAIYDFTAETASDYPTYVSL